MTYLQHGERHRPDGTDPIPVDALAAVGLPSAVFTKTISSPITSYLDAQDIECDTVQTSAVGAAYFSIDSSPSPHPVLATGFYLCVGMIQFASAATDWSAVGGGSFADLSVASSGADADLEMSTTISTAATPTYLDHITTTNYLAISGVGVGFSLGFAVANNTSPLPVGIAVARAVVVRISGEYSITV